MTSGRMGGGVLKATLGLTLLMAACAQGASGDGSSVGTGEPDATSGVDAAHADGSHPSGDGGSTRSDATGPHDSSSTFIDVPGSGDDAGGDDSGGSDATSGADTGPGTDSSTCPMGTTGTGCSMCSTGFHLCGATCTADETNDPSVGCSQSCGGTACAVMGSEVASCTAAGQCTYACPSGLLSCGSGVCAACCTNTDCSGSTPDCVSGTCQAPACNAPSGLCGSVCTNLSTNTNCGSCGTNCPNSAECIASTLAGFPFGCACGPDGSGGYECD